MSGSFFRGTRKFLVLVDSVEEDMVVAAGKLRRRHNIDHICVSEGLAEKVKVGAWEGRNAQEKRMSDHNGVFVDVYKTI